MTRLTKEKPLKTAAVYARISKPKRGERQVSLETQEADLRDLAAREEYEPVVFVETASASAFAKGERPIWNRLLRGLGDFDAVLAWKQDRLGRDEADWHTFVRAAGINETRILTLDGTDIDPSDENDDLLSPSVKAMVAAQESRNTSRRVRRGLAARADEGKAHGGPRPYGYTRRDTDEHGRPSGPLVIEPAEAAIVRECADRVLRGETLTAITIDMRNRGVPSAKGKSWARKALLGVLTNPTTVGARRREDGSLVVGWEGILSIEEHEQLVGILRDPARRIGNARPRRHVLSSGLLTCGQCGHAMKGRQHGERRDYTCPPPTDGGGCGRVLIKADPLEEIIVNASLARLSTPRLRTRLLGIERGGPDLETAYREREELHRTRDGLADLLGAGDLSAAQFKRANVSNEKALAVLDRRIKSEQDAHSLFIDDLPADDAGLVRWWERASLLQRHALIGAVLDHATIAKGVKGRHGFQSDRVELTWR